MLIPLIVSFLIKTIDITHFATTLLQLILKFIITEKQDTKKQTKTVF